MIVRGDVSNRQSVVQIMDNLIAKFLNTNSIEKEDIKTIFDVTKMNRTESNPNSIYSDNDAIKTSKKNNFTEIGEAKNLRRCFKKS